MISLPECRRILGATAERFSDDEMLSIRDALRELAELALETMDDYKQRKAINYQPKPLKIP